MTENNNSTLASETEESELAFSPRIRRAVRSKHIRVGSAAEIGALVRLARQRLAMNQTDAAACCGVGRRFLVDLEGGKENVQLDKVLQVLDALGIELTIGGSGALFSLAELSTVQIFSKKKEETEHVWNVEFTTREPSPYKAEGGLMSTRPFGKTEHKLLKNVISTGRGLYIYDEEQENLVKVPEGFTEKNSSHK